MGPVRSNHPDTSEEKATRSSPQQKRAASPADGIAHKKVKLDPTIKKKQPSTIVKTENTSKNIVNKKPSKLTPCKSSSVLEEKTSKNVPMKESNLSTNNNHSTLESKLHFQ